MLQWMGSEDGDDTSGTLFRDIIIFCFGVVAAVVVMILPHINKPESQDEESRRRGNIRVEIIWPAHRDVDVDLWCQAPGDVPVGYSNKGGQVFNLLRDDLGHNDLTNINYEVAFTRGLPAGEYIINLHYYRGDTGTHPGAGLEIEVEVLITIKKEDSVDSKESPQKILKTKVKLLYVKEEITAARFILDKDMNVVAGSLNRVQKKIRSEEPTSR